MLIDSHCHLDQLIPSPDRRSGEEQEKRANLDEILNHARAEGVEYFLCVCIDMNNLPQTLAVAHSYQDVSASIGVHPSDKESEDPSVEQLVKLAGAEKVVAIGETGLDYSRTQGDVTWQQERFRRHIRAAREVGKPLIVHTRDARADTIRILKEEKAHEVGGVLHCFTESLEMAQQAMELGFYISFSGIITFKNAVELQAVVKEIPLERMLIETDSPYLAPVPYRGKPNQPAWVKYVAEKIAELTGQSYSTVAKITTQNFKQLFKTHL